MKGIGQRVAPRLAGWIRTRTASFEAAFPPVRGFLTYAQLLVRFMCFCRCVWAGRGGYSIRWEACALSTRGTQ